MEDPLQAIEFSDYSAVLIGCWVLDAFAVLASYRPEAVRDVLCRLLEATTFDELQSVKVLSAELLAGKAITPIGETEIIINAMGVLRKEDVAVMGALVAAGAFNSDARLIVDSHIRALGGEPGANACSQDHAQAGVDSDGLPCSPCCPRKTTSIAQPDVAQVA